MEDNFFVDIGLYATYFLMIVAIAAAVVLPIVHSLGDPKSLIGIGIAVVALLVLFFISYAISSDVITNPKAAANYGITANGAKFIGGTLIMMYILAFIAIIGIVVSEVTKLIK